MGKRILFRQSDWQFWGTANHYRIRLRVKWVPENPPLAQAFVYGRSLVVAPQKSGKGSWTAAITAGEAVGPSMFCGEGRRRVLLRGQQLRLWLGIRV